jgi:hypothetical protein
LAVVVVAEMIYDRQGFIEHLDCHDDPEHVAFMIMRITLADLISSEDWKF